MLINVDPLNTAPLNTNGEVVGKATAYSKVTVLATIEVASKRARAWSKISVYATGRATAYSEIAVVPTVGRARAYSKVSVYAIGRAKAHTALAVLGDSTEWRAQVILGGVDVSVRLTGQVWVDPEEGAARVANFTLVPQEGAINPFSYVGAEVFIDYVTIEGATEIPQRLFVGKVNVPTYDVWERTITFDCTNDFQNTIAAMPREQILALIGGRYDEAIQGEVRDNWEYAQALLESVPASLDAGNLGELRVTPWNGLPQWRELTEDDIFEKTLTVDLPQRDTIINRIDARFEYRFFRLRRRTARISFSVDIKTTVDYGLPLLARDTVESAMQSTGWELGSPPTTGIGAFRSAISSSIQFTPYPDTYEIPLVGSSYNYTWKNTEPDTTCMAFSATLWKRFYQTVTEDYAITVLAPQSIAQNGTIAAEERGSLASEWDASAWENDPAASPVLTGADREVVLDYAPDATTAMRDAANQTLIDVCKTRLLAKHRSARVGAAIPLDPQCDLNRRPRIVYTDDGVEAVKASGKVARLRHVMDLDNGEATTEFWMAISGHGAVGLPTLTTPTAAPDAPEVPATAEENLAGLSKHLQAVIGATESSPDYTEDLEGWLVNVPASFNVDDQGGNSYQLNTETQQEVAQPYQGSVANPAYKADKAFPITGLRFNLPGVESAARDATVMPATQTVLVEIPEDELILAA